ncbi:HERV-H LTR-associating protein 2 isoform X2 [Brachyhypopomus gauderio]|uniref:HERV-H LTR-associating protein 2 isoform X2 n=1 Tax=Brachyhypopomus gauderio TaxID=698409 RepID=UPI00404268C5
MIKELILLWLLSLTVCEDNHVTCVFSEECVLPCKSSYHDIIHWMKIDSQGEVAVHSFYKGEDQLNYQNEAYSGRTSMFSDQISTGNVSLTLRGIRIQDQGKYKCYTASSTANKEAFVLLSVEAPIKSVDIKKTDDRITCNTRNVYPKPTISWNINGPVDENPAHLDSQGLFSISSTVSQAHLSNSTYICSIRLGDKTQPYTASLKQEKIEIFSGENVTIHCPREDTGTFNYTLTFEDSSNIQSDILSYNSEVPQPHPSTSWRGANVSVTQEGTITVHNLDSERHTGTYSCESRTPLSRQLVQTCVEIQQGSTMLFISSSSRTIIIIIIIIMVCCIIIALVAFWFVKKQREKRNIKKKSEDQNDVRFHLNSNDGTRDEKPSTELHEERFH